MSSNPRPQVDRPAQFVRGITGNGDRVVQKLGVHFYGLTQKRSMAYPVTRRKEGAFQ